MNSHVEVAEVDGGADEARGGVVAGALPREAQSSPRRQRPPHRSAPPPAHSAGPDDDQIKQIKVSRSIQATAASKQKRTTTGVDEIDQRAARVLTWRGRGRWGGGRGRARGGRWGAAPRAAPAPPPSRPPSARLRPFFSSLARAVASRARSVPLLSRWSRGEGAGIILAAAASIAREADAHVRVDAKRGSALVWIFLLDRADAVAPCSRPARDVWTGSLTC